MGVYVHVCVSGLGGGHSCCTVSQPLSPLNWARCTYSCQNWDGAHNPFVGGGRGQPRPPTLMGHDPTLVATEARLIRLGCLACGRLSLGEASPMLAQGAPQEECKKKGQQAHRKNQLLGARRRRDGIIPQFGTNVPLRRAGTERGGRSRPLTVLWIGRSSDRGLVATDLRFCGNGWAILESSRGRGGLKIRASAGMVLAAFVRTGVTE